jgi:hypothetical protein
VVASSVLWLWLYNPNFGLFNEIFQTLHLPKSLWLSGQTTVVPSIIIMSVWGGAGNTIVIFLAALQGVPRHLLEAVEIDGGNWWHRFWAITWPMISPVTFFNLVIGLINSFQVFTQDPMELPHGRDGHRHRAARDRFFPRAEVFCRGGDADRHQDVTEEGIMKRAAVLLVLFFFLAGATAAFAQGTSKGDARVAAQLDRLGLHYKLTDSGNYSITFDVESGRSQVAYIMAKTETYKGLEIREIWSRAGTFEDLPESDVMQKLLEDSAGEKIGFWSIEEADNGGWTVYFSVKVPVYLKDADLKSLLELTANVGDEKEAELFNQDEE